MNNIGEAISNLLKQKGKSVADFSNDLELSRTACYDILKKESIDTNLLLRISKVLNVPITYFFTGLESDPSAVNEKVKDLEERIRYLEDSLAIELKKHNILIEAFSNNLDMLVTPIYSESNIPHGFSFGLDKLEKLQIRDLILKNYPEVKDTPLIEDVIRSIELIGIPFRMSYLLLNSHEKEELRLASYVYWKKKEDQKRIGKE
ncbi:MAG: hypothetical protein Q7J34_06360 [Bacteroidales bacterium]|nr:hypothetical protein [Bacteroidales bacterium]